MDRHSSVNRLYRLVWNETLLIWTAVAEIAKGRGKSSSRRKIAAVLTAAVAVGSTAMAGGNAIQPDGRTETTLSGSGNVTDVRTGTMRGANAFNSFAQFTVGSGQVVNMHLPSGSSNLINLVADQRATINGMLNSIKGSKIGGNLYFATPHGFVVGAGGVVNVGSLTVSTPPRAFLDSFFSDTGEVDALSIDALLNGSAPDEGGSISIEGKVNAIGGVKFRGGMVRISGTVYRGARFVGLAPDFSDVVNVNGLASGTKIVEIDGRIQVVTEDDPATAVAAAVGDAEQEGGNVDIQAATDVSVSGEIRNEGSEGVNGGQIAIQAGNNIALDAGAVVSAAGRGSNSSGGTVYMMAANNSVIRAGATVDASAGISGNAGAIEFSAKNNVELAGGQFKASATVGTMGTVLIDPTDVTVSANFYSNGAAYTIQADNTVTVNSGVVVSTRNVVGGAGADQVAAASAGNSGSLTVQAGSVTLQSGSALVSHADSGFTGGDISISATRTATSLLGGGGTAGITASGATIKGAAVSLQAQSDYDDTGASLPLPLAIPTATAAVSLTDTSISASGTLAIGAKSSVDTRPLGSTPLAISVVNSSATVNVAGAYLLDATGNATLNAESSVVANVTPSGLGLALPADAAVAISTINSTAKVKVGGSGAINTDAVLELSAKNTVEATTVADISASKPSAVGGTVAVTVLNSVTQASINDSASTQAASLSVLADSKNTVVNTAKSATKGAKKQTAAEKAANASESEKALADYKSEGTTAGGGSVEVAAAVAVVSLNSQTSAVIRSTGLQDSTGLATVSSRSSNSSAVKADGSSVGTGAVGVGAAVAINIGVLDNSALIADNALVTGDGLSLIADLRSAAEKNSFSTQSISGAGTSGVGVAGSLAVGTVVSTTTAALEKNTDGLGSGATVNAGTGDVLVQAGDATSSTVDAGAQVTGSGSSAKVGVGASIGVNVGVNSTVAELGDGAALNGGHDLALNATAEHLMATTVTGGAAGASVAITPVAAVSVGLNETTTRLGTGAALALTGSYASQAEQTSEQTTVATGQTEGSSVSVGASIAVGVAEDTVAASVERNLDATTGVAVAAIGTSKSDTSATASVKGGKEADNNGDAPAGQSVDDQVKGQGDAAKDSGSATTTKAGKTGAGGKLSDSKAKENPKAESNGQGVSVAAAVGVNVSTHKVSSTVANGVEVDSADGALSVASTAETDAQAKADGSQVDAGGTNVGVGAAVAVNAVTTRNTAVVGDNAQVATKGLSIKAEQAAGESNDFGADATSGAGASKVGVAGSLALNIIASITRAQLLGDANLTGAGVRNVDINASSSSVNTVKAAAEVAGTGEEAQVGVGASVGVNVAVNTTLAEVADGSELIGGSDMTLNATADHAMDTEVTGGAGGAKVAITPVVAVSVGINETTARLGTGATGLGLSGSYSSHAEQSTEQKTVATGQTEGSSVSVGASIAVGVADDTVSASIERDLSAGTTIDVAALGTSKSDSSATASVKGGKKADENGDAPAEPGGAPGSGKTVDQQVNDQGDSAKESGRKNAVSGGDTGAGDKLDASKGKDAPSSTTSEGGVSVAAAVGVNVADHSVSASVARGTTVHSNTGALSVASTAETDALAKADGSQVDAGGTNVGVGAAVAVNAATSRNTATVGDNAQVTTQGLTVKAEQATGQVNDYGADAKSGAGAANVGVAGSLGLNIITSTTKASLEGDADGDGVGANVDAGAGNILVSASSASKSTVKAGAEVEGTGGTAKVGVGVAVGVHVAVNTTMAEVADRALLRGGANMAINATAAHEAENKVEGGAAGAKVSITPVVAVSVGVNTTQARIGSQATGLNTGLNLSGALTSDVEQTHSLVTEAKGSAQGDVAVGAALVAAIAVDDVGSTLQRDVDTYTGVDLSSTSATSLKTDAMASAKGNKKTDKDGDGQDDSGTTADEQKKTQLDFAKGKNTGASGVNTDTPESKTPDTSNETPGTTKPAGAPAKEQQGKKISVAAAIGVGVAVNQSRATIGEDLNINAGTGALKLHAGSDTNYSTKSTGEAVSDENGIAVAVSVTVANNKTEAILGQGTTVSQAGDVGLSAESHQNRGAGFVSAMSAEAVSGASGGEVAVAGALALVVNDNTTRASIDEGVTLGTTVAPVVNVTVTAEDTSKIAAQSRAGAISFGANAKTGVGASFAVLVSNNVNEAIVGRDADDNGSTDETVLHAQSLDVAATKYRVNALKPKNFSLDDIKALNFNSLLPSNFLGSNNYYTEALAGAASQGNTAVAGSFAVNVFQNTSNAAIGNNVKVTTRGVDGVGVASSTDTLAIAFTGAVAGAKQTGVGISNTNLVNLDSTTASIGEGAEVLANGTDADVTVSATSKQDFANIGVSAGASANGTAVAGVLGVMVSLGTTEATVGDGAEVKAKGDVSVMAHSDSTGMIVTGGVGASGTTGVGASIAANVLANTTRARIGEDADVSGGKTTTVSAIATETSVSAVVAGAGAGTTAVAGALSVNVMVGDTSATVGNDAHINTDVLYSNAAQGVAIKAQDDTTVTAITGGGAGGGTTGVGAALDTTVFAKTVKAGIDDSSDADLTKAEVNARKDVLIDAISNDNLTSVTVGFGGGGTTGVGGAVSVAVVKNDVQARIGTQATVDADANAGVNAEDSIKAVLAAGGVAGGGTTGVGGSIGVATLLGTTKATIGESAVVNARGQGAARDVISGETVFSDTSNKPATLGAKLKESAKGLSVTAYNREELITTAFSAGGGGTTGVAATVSANVIASVTEASIGRSAKINQDNAGAGVDQQVRVKAVDETLLINTAGGAAGGGTAGVGAAANVGVIVKSTTASIGKGAVVNARRAMDMTAASADLSVSTTLGLAGGGSVGVGGAVGGVGVSSTTRAFIEDGTSALDAARVNVTGGDLTVGAEEFASSWLISGGAGGAGAVGVGASLSVAVNSSTTEARIGDHTVTDATGTTAVSAESLENVNTVTVAGAGGGSVGVSGSIAVNVVASHTEAAIGANAQVNQASSGTAQDVSVTAKDRIVSVAIAGAAAGGGAAGVGVALDVTVAQNKTIAAIEGGADVAADRDVKVEATGDKYVNALTVAGSGGGAAGVSGAVSIIAVGSLLEGEAKKGLASRQGGVDGQTNKSAVGDMLGDSEQSTQTKLELDSRSSKMAMSSYVSDSAPVPTQNTQASIGAGATVNAGRDVSVAAEDKTTVVMVSGTAAGGGAAGVGGSVGVVLLRDSAAATIADNATVDAARTIDVNAKTADTVYNVALSAAGGGAAAVSVGVAVNVVSSQTVAAIGNADINQSAAALNRSVLVGAKSDSNLITVAGSGGGAGAAAVGGVVNVNTLTKNTSAHIAEGAVVDADKDVVVSADSEQSIIGAGVSIQVGGGAGVGVTVAVNVVDNTTEAFIGSAADDETKLAANVESAGNVVISAADDTLLVGVAASGTGAGAAAVGGTVSVNVVSSETSAYLGDDSVVVARGQGTGAEVYDGSIDNATTRALPAQPAGTSSTLDIDKDGTADGGTGGGASFTVKGSGSGGSGNASGNANASTTKDSQGNAIGNAGGGLGTRGKQTVNGFTVAAVGSEKVVTASLGVAAAGAVGVTLGVTADVISSKTTARIGDGAQVNQGGGAVGDVRVTASDDTFMVMAAGTVAGAALAGIGGSSNTAVVSKQTSASIGDASVSGNNLKVAASASEDIFVATANVAAGFAGVGAAVSVATVSNTTTADVEAGASLDAVGDLRVTAGQDTSMDLYTVAGAGGVVGVSGAISVGVVDNTTRASVHDSASAVGATTLDGGGTTEVAATSSEQMNSVTVSAAVGAVGVAGSVGVKVLTSETTASIGNNTRVNQTRGGAAQDVIVSASDTVHLQGGGGSGAVGGFFGAGAMSDTNIVRNTTTASIGTGAVVDADRDVAVTAASSKQVDSTAVAIAASLGGGVAGAVSVAVIGTSLDDESQEGLGDGNTAAKADTQMKKNDAGAELAKGDSTQLGGARATLSSKTSSLGVASDMNSTDASSRDKTQASVGNSARVTAGRDIDVTADDKTQLDLQAIGAGGGFAGIGAAVGVGLSNSTTEAKVGSSAVLEANSDNIGTGNILVGASAGNVNGTGSRVRSTAGAGGVIGVSAAVSVLNDSSTTRALLGNGAQVQRASAFTVQADTDRKSSATTLGASAGALAIGASVARANFSGTTSAYFEPNVDVGQTAGKVVGSMAVMASDSSVASANATAGTAGILSGSGADAKATVESDVSAYLDDGAEVMASGSVTVDATGTAQTRADAVGVNIGAGSVGASLASARSDATIEARLGASSSVQASAFNLSANRLIGSAPTAAAKANGATGGVLFGINATQAKAESSGRTSALVGANATLSGAVNIEAESHTQQVASGVGISIGGLLAVGADKAAASSNTTTEAVLGDGAKVTGASLTVNASGHDANYAHGRAGSGGLVSAPFSLVETVSNATTTASTGSGSNAGGVNARKIDVGALNVAASQHNQFDAWIDSTNASLVGVSGAKAVNSSNANTLARLGPNGYIEADSILLAAHNEIDKVAPGAQIPGIGVSVPSWNVDSASGGLADVPAAGSTTTIVNNAAAQVGAGTHLEQTGSVLTPGAFQVDAWNDVRAVDRVKMASGGAVSAASGKSEIVADTNNATVSVGNAADLTGTGDIAMGARSIADISTQTSVDVWGLVGVAPAGDSVSRFQAVNTIDIGSANMEALNDIRLNAGASSNYNPATDSGGETNQMNVRARTDVFNNTAIPVNRDPVADAIITAHSQINVGTGANLGAVRHAQLYAEKGTASASGVGVGKDIYREALAAVASAVSNAFGGGDVSFETRTGRSIRNQTSDALVQGDVHVGLHRKQFLEIGMDGTVSNRSDGINVVSTGVRNLAQDILNRIDALNDLIRQYTVADATADASIAVAAYRSEIRFLERKLVEMGFRSAAGESGFSGVASISPLQAAQESVTAMTNTRTTLTFEQNTLTNQNSTLRTQNTTLEQQNTNLGNQNLTLQGEVATLQAEILVLNGQIAGASGTAQQALIDQRNAKQALVNTKTGTIDSNNNTIDRNSDTITSNTNTINTNTPLISALTTRIDDLTGQIVFVQGDINDGDYSSVPIAGPSATFLTVSDAEAKLGNIYVKADRLHGTGTLDAPGDAEIRITNEGPSFLVINNLTIPPDEGGKIYYNNIDVKDNVGINGVSGRGGAAFTMFTAESQIDSDGNPVTPGKPRILIESKYDPLDPQYFNNTPAGTPALSPDIVVQGEISNLRGLVKIDSAAGSIRLEEHASIRADEVEVKTRNGDFVQSYTNTFFHTAGAPLSTTNGDPARPFPSNIAQINRTPETATSGIVANGSVLIAARYLNINGTIQSGIPEWGVRVPASASVTVAGAYSQDFTGAQAHFNSLSAADKADPAKAYYLVSGADVAGLAGNLQGNWEKITVRYNAKEDRLELGGVRVQGGYIELFGQIFNTNQSGGGKLRVMDGYGQVKIDNQTGKTMWVNLLDTGKGVKGEINITNIASINADGTPVITTTNFSRGTGARSAFYDPTAGLRYTMTVGYDQVREDFYRYSQSGWFGGAILESKQLDQYRINSITRSNDPLSQAEYLQTGAVSSQHYIPGTGAVYTPENTGTPALEGAITGGQQQTKETAPGVVVPGRSWRDCNWWTLCINATHYQEFTVTTGTKTTITDSVKGDYRIGIEYIGFDNGTVNVASTGNVVINGAINNRNGNTSISSAGSITQNGDLAIVTGNSIALTAGTGIGSATQAIQTNIADSGKLDATSTSGEVHVKEMVGELHVGTVGGAGVSNVVLQSDKSILGFNAASVVQGKRVELNATNGGIGASGSPLTVRTGYTTSQSQWPNNGLMASARDSINLKNEADAVNLGTYSGNLLLIAANSTVGDVRVETSGAVIDNNPFATTDSLTEAQLAALWDELRLRGAPSVQKADEAVAAFERGKDNNYRLYWQLRKGQTDQGMVYNPAYAYQVSAGERAALEASGLDAVQISQFEADRTAQYRALHTEVGGLSTVFDAAFAYNASPTEEASIRDGATWTDAQLALSVGAGLLKNTTDTVTTVKAPNAKGRNIELVAGASIGSLDDSLTIDLSAGLGSLTQAQKAALAAAERGDATVSGNVITINRPRPVNVSTGTGALTATASNGSAYIGSEDNLRINSVTATGDVRIKTAESLINAATVAGATNVTGRQIILEAANGGIGAVPDAGGVVASPLRVSPGAGVGLIARAAADIWVETLGDLTVDTIFSRTDVKVDAVGSIMDMAEGSPLTPDLNIRSDDMTLIARTGSIGSLSNPLDVGVNPDGRIYAAALTAGQEVFLNGPSGEHFNIGSVESGGSIGLSAANTMLVDGGVTAPGGVSLTSGGTTTLSTQADVQSVVGPLQVRAGALVMRDDGVEAARLRAATGTIDIETLGDATVTGIESGNGTDAAVRLVSTAAHVLDAGDTRLDVIADTAPDAKLTVAGALGVGADGNPLDVRLRSLEAESSEGSVDIAVNGDVDIGTVEAGDAVRLTASGDITGDTVRSSGAGTQDADKRVSVVSSGGKVQLAVVEGTQDVSLNGLTGLELGSVTSTGGSVVLYTGEGDIEVDRTVARRDVTMSAPAGAIQAGFTSAGGDVTMRALRDVVAEDTRAGGSIVVDSETGQVIADRVRSGRDFKVESAGAITMGTVIAGGDIALSSTRATVAVGTTQARGDIEVSGQRGVTVGRATAGRDLTLESARGAIDAETLVARRGTIELEAQRNVDVESARAEVFIARSNGGNVNVGTANADVVSMAAPGQVSARAINVGSSVNLEGTRVSADVQTTGPVDVTGSVTGFGGGMASDVQLQLSTPYAFRFSNLFTSTGNLGIATGDLYIGSLWVGNRMTLNNPVTRVVVDQNDRSIQPFDVQLYSAGNPFVFSLAQNRVTTGSLVISRGPDYEVLSPSGSNRSATEQADFEFGALGSLPSPFFGLPLGPGLGGAPGSLVRFAGFPVRTDDECKDAAVGGPPNSPNPKCKEDKQ